MDISYLTFRVPIIFYINCSVPHWVAYIVLSSAAYIGPSFASYIGPSFAGSIGPLISHLR